MIGRYLRAFFVALRMTLRGEQPPPPRYPTLTAWTQQTVKLVDAVYTVAEQQGIDRARRQTLVLHVDKRDISVETILATIRHHAAQEYPYLLRVDIAHNLTALYASNLNDCYLALRLSELDALQAPPLKTTLDALRNHLEAVPPEKP